MVRAATPARLSSPAPKPCRYPPSMSSEKEESCTVTTTRLPASVSAKSAVTSAADRVTPSDEITS